MDIHLFLEEWNTIEPNRCSYLHEDFWQFHFDKPGTDRDALVRCDVISVHGVGIIEDLVVECIQARHGWTYRLEFDREEELFVAYVSDTKQTYMGLESLNPGIAMLSAYLNSLKNKQVV